MDAELREYLDEIAQQFKAQTSRIAALTAQTATGAPVETPGQERSARVDGLDAWVDDRYVAVRERFDHVDLRLDHMSGQISDLRQQAIALRKRVDHLDDRLSRLVERVVAVETTLLDQAGRRSALWRR